jgi:hypothetical protein
MILIDKSGIYIEKLIFLVKNQMLKYKFTCGFPLNQNVFPEHENTSLSL